MLATDNQLRGEIDWIDHRPVPPDFGGPTELAFEPFQDAWIDLPPLTRFEAQAEQRPDKLAIDDGRLRLTYGEARRAVHRLAAEIDVVAPAGEVIVAILQNDAVFPIAVLACLASGRPLIPVDCNYPAARRAAILRESGVGLLLLGEGVQAEDALVSPATPRMTIRLRTDADVVPPQPKPSPQGVGGIVFTSGSTGRPKGVALAARSLLSAVAEFTNACHLNAEDRVLSLATLSVGGIMDALCALYTGATVRICDIGSAGLGEVVRILEEERITVLSFIPLVVRTLMQLPASEQTWRTLRLLNLYGDRTSLNDIDLFRSKLPASCFIRVALGSMEAGTIFHGFVGRPPESDGVSVSAGYLARDVSVLILNEAGEPAPIDEEGELVVRSSAMGLGAWQDGQLVPGPFLPDPESGARRIFHTGDLVRLRPSGLVQLVGRRDRRIKIRGLRADPADLEAALRSYAGVADAAVIARQAGEEAVLIAYVTPDGSEATVCEASLQQRLAEDVPEHLAPLEIHFLAKIPRLPNHKPDLVELTRRDRADRVLRHHLPTDVSPQPPGPGDLQAKVADAVAKAWSAVLGAQSFAENRDWTSSGGDSLKALRLSLHLEKALDRKTPLDVLDRDATPRGLAGAVIRYLAQEAAGEETRPVIFLLPGIGGDDQGLAQFRRSLGRHLRFELVDYPDVDRPSSEIGDLETIVSDALGQIRRRSPTGPLAIAGYSMGGLVGLEVALRLQAEGRPPSFFGVLDTELSDRAPPRAQVARQIWGARKEGPLWLLQYAPAVLLVAAARYEPVRRSVLLARKRLGAHRGLTVRNLLVHSLQIKAMRQLQLRPYSGPLSLLRAAVPQTPTAAEDLGWRRLCSDVQVFEVDGDHWSMFEEQHLLSVSAQFLRAVAASGLTSEPAGPVGEEAAVQSGS